MEEKELNEKDGKEEYRVGETYKWEKMMRSIVWRSKKEDERGGREGGEEEGGRRWRLEERTGGGGGER